MAVTSLSTAHSLSHQKALLFQKLFGLPGLLYLVNRDDISDSTVRHARCLAKTAALAGSRASADHELQLISSTALLTLLTCGFPAADLRLSPSDLELLQSKFQGVPKGLPDQSLLAAVNARLLALRHVYLQDDILATLVKQCQACSDNGVRFQAACHLIRAITASPHDKVASACLVDLLDTVCSLWEQDNIGTSLHSSAYLRICLLLLSTLINVFDYWQQGHLPAAHNLLVECRIPIIVFQILGNVSAKFLTTKNVDQSLLSVAGSLLVLAQATQLPLPGPVKEALNSEFIRCQKRLRTTNLAHLLTQHVDLGDKAALICAYGASQQELTWAQALHDVFDVPSKKLTKLSGFFSMLPMLKPLSHTTLLLAVMESTFYGRKLQTVLFDIFPPRGELKLGKYLEHVPLTWTACNYLPPSNGTSVPSLPGKVLWDMILVTVLIFQADEYMETVPSQLSEVDVEQLKATIRRECGMTSISPERVRSIATALAETSGLQTPPLDDNELDKLVDLSTPAVISPDAESLDTSPADIVKIEEVETVLTPYIKRMVNHSAVLNAPAIAHKYVAAEMCSFLLSHLAHNRDNERLVTQWKQQDALTRTLVASIAKNDSALAAQTSLSNRLSDQIRIYNATQPSFLDWVRSTASDNTSVPASFALFLCLISNDATQTQTSASNSQHCFSKGAKHVYLSQALARHLAAVCRMDNDIGSLERDITDENVNCLNFPEFAPINVPLAISDTKTSSKDTAESDKNNEAEAPAKTLYQQWQEQGVKQLNEIISFERSCMQDAKRRLCEVLDRGSAAKIDAFVNVVEIYGEIYTLRDISSRKK